MPQVCWYFQLHQPYRLSEFSVFDVGNEAAYFVGPANNTNKAIFQKVARKSYLPMLRLLKKLVGRFPDFCFAISCSGVFLEQAQEYQPEVVTLLQSLVKTGQVEVLAETYYHSLASLYSPPEFVRQVALHQKKIHELFGVTPKVFRNTELIYSNEVAEQVVRLGYVGMLTEAVPRYLHDRGKTQVFRSATEPTLPLLLKHAELSDDIAFRFSDRNWQWYPLGADRYLEWLEIYAENETVNLFMDFETFGEHQWEDTGIFNFFEELITRFRDKSWNTFVTPSQVCAQAGTNLEKVPIYDVPLPISWADVDRDLTAWTDNAFQSDTLRIVYELGETVLASGDPALIEDWGRLQTSDHFYYMCTKWAADGDVHAYFSPYDSPYEAYRRFGVVLADLRGRLGFKTLSQAF